MARENTFKTKALEFIAANPGLKRKAYIEAFVGFGMKESAASLYHYIHVTKANKAKPVAEVEKAPEVEVAPELDTTPKVVSLDLGDVETKIANMSFGAHPRDAKGRFVKRS